MESIRKFLKSWPGRIFLMLCLSPLVILGLESYFGGRANANEVAKVGNQTITRTQYQDAITERRSQLINSGIDASAINTNALNENVLEGLINRALLRNQVELLGMSVSDEVINNILIQDPQFLDKQGKFSNERFAFALNQQGISKDQLFAEYKQQISLGQLYSNIAKTALYPEAEINDLLALQLETRDVWVYRLPWEDFKDKVTVLASEIEQYYDTHKAELNSLAMVDLSYIQIDPSKITVEDITEDEIKAQYDAFKANYIGDYTQQVSQILITGNNAEKTIKEVEKKLKSGESFAALAKQYSDDESSKNDGGDIGTFNPDIFGEDAAKVAKVIEGLKQGQFSAPIKTGFGYQIFKVTAMSSDNIPSMQSVREQLIEQATRDKKENAIADMITRINDMAMDGVSIEDIAQQEQLSVYQIKNYSKKDNFTKLNQPAVIEAAFDDFTIQNESVSPSIKVNSGTLWVQPINYRPIKPLTLQQATAQIIDILTKEKATKLALQEAKNIARIANDKGMEATQVSFEDLGNINRQNSKLTLDEKATAYSTEGMGDKLFAVATQTDAGATAMMLGPITRGSIEQTPKPELLQAMFDNRTIRGGENFSDYIEYLKISTHIKKNESVINEVGGL